MDGDVLAAGRSGETAIRSEDTIAKSQTIFYGRVHAERSFGLLLGTVAFDLPVAALGRFRGCLTVFGAGCPPFAMINLLTGLGFGYSLFSTIPI